MWLKFAVTVFLPIVLQIIFFVLKRYTGFVKWKDWQQQVVVGVAFGVSAVLSTLWGAEISGCVVSVRDAAALTAGLFYGPVAGAISGIMGGAFRFISVYMGFPGYTQVACTIATILAGLNGALVRKTILDNHHPSFLLSIAITVVTEVMHMMLVVIMKLNDIDRAFEIVETITIPFVFVNSFTVSMSALFRIVVSTLQNKKEHNIIRTTQKIQRWLVFFVTSAFVLTSALVIFIQQKMADSTSEQMLTQGLFETTDDVIDATDASLLAVTKNVASVVTAENINEIQEKFDVTVIEIVNSEGYVIASSDPNHVFFNMNSGEQSKEFLCLLGDTQEFVQDYQPLSLNSNESMKYAGVKVGNGFIQVGRDAEALQKNISEEVKNITKNRHIGETGYIIILDEQGKIVSAPKDLDQTEIDEAVQRISFEITEDNVHAGTLNDEEVLYSFRDTEGYRVVTVLPQAEAYSSRNRAIYINSFLEILVFALLFILIYFLIKRIVLRPINNVNRSLERIAEELKVGEAKQQVYERETREFDNLSRYINKTVEALNINIKETEKRAEQELGMARDIQEAAVPSVFPKSNDFEVYALTDPAKQVGGDFYDVYLTNNILNFCIADVSGKGVPAAMFMMRAMTELRSLTETGKSVGEVFQKGNNALCTGNDASMFVTAWQGGLNLETGEVKYSSAGHNPPLLYRKGEGFSFLRSKPGFILAGMEDVRYREETFKMQPMDILFLYTDGVTECTNKNQELYGEERLLKFLNGHKFTTMQSILEALRRDLDNFQGEAPQFDDITMMALCYTARQGYPTITTEEAEISDIPRVTEFVEDELGKLGCTMKNLIKFNVAIDEIFSNIVKYGYGDKKGKVMVSVGETDVMHFVRFQDWGTPWNPLTNRDPDVTLSAEERQIGGLGIYMVKKSMDDVKYRYEKDSNVFTIFKRKTDR